MTDYAKEQQAEGWLHVCSVLDELVPNWTYKKGTGMECAEKAIRKLYKKAQKKKKSVF